MFDVPLLVESPRWRPQLDLVIVVDCSESTQLRRVVRRVHFLRHREHRAVAPEHKCRPRRPKVFFAVHGLFHDRIRRLYLDDIGKGNQLFSCEGEVIGQVNGLTVVSYGDASFGLPSRISVTAHYGSGEITDIERDVELGGAAVGDLEPIGGDLAVAALYWGAAGGNQLAQIV